MKLFLVFLIITTFCLVAGQKYRLSTTVNPLFYSIKIHPDLDKEIFKGEVAIQVNVKSSVEYIEFHSSNLKINCIHLNSEKVYYIPNDCEFNNTQSKEDTLGYKFSDHELIEIGYATKKMIVPGNYIIHIKYDGKFSNTASGLFKARLTKDNMTYSTLAVTDLEPTFARRVFPCFDEPSFKAKFQLTLVAPNSSYTAISNMREVKHFTVSYGVVYKFETSHLMSTYLLAFAISQYSYGELIGFQKIPIRVYSVNASDENNKRTMEYANKAIEFYTEYTCYNYPLPKLDMIEYDRTESTATENWGLITFNTGFLSPKLSYYDEYQIVNVIAHEIAHFWFGNLVTNEWWDDIWLQEGFAVYMSLKAEEYILNNNATNLFPSTYLDDVYWYDFNNDSTPVVNFAVTPSEIRKNFNDITYTKGAALLRMVEMVIGKENFQCALRKYIHGYASKTATTDSFLSILDNIDSTIDLRGFMESYLYQNRYPIVQVDENDQAYILKQRSCGFQKNDPESPFGYRWTIPITYSTSLNKRPKLIWFDRNMENLTIPKSNETWMKLNHQQIGLYRTNYSESLWEKFMVHYKDIEAHERDHLLLEAVYFYENNVISCDIALRYLKFGYVKNLTRINSQYIFVAYVKMRPIENYDMDAYKLLESFFLDILKSTGRNKLAWSLKLEMNRVPKAEPIKVPPEKMKLCAQWIKKNLPIDFAVRKAI